MFPIEPKKWLIYINIEIKYYEQNTQVESWNVDGRFYIFLFNLT